MEHSICLLDSNVQSLLDIQLHPLLRTLNLHGNAIRRIQNLTMLHNLRHLDLSSNRLTIIEGLDGLVMLRTLNLSCNFLQTVDGLKNLRCLVSINLSYNRITDLSGFHDVSGHQYQLQQVSLHGNCLQSTSHILQCLRGCTSLCELVLKYESKGNPVCEVAGYRQTILNGLPWLRVLDGNDRNGRSVPLCEGALQSRTPDIEPFLDYLMSSPETKAESANTENNNIPLLLPNNEDALDRYRMRGSQNSDHSLLSSELKEQVKELENSTTHEFQALSTGHQATSLKRNRHLSRSSPALETTRDGFSAATAARLTVSTVMDYSSQKIEHNSIHRISNMISKTSESTQTTSSSSDEKNTQPTRRSTPNLRIKRRINRRDVAYDSDSTTDFTEGGENYRMSRSSLPRSIRQRRKHSSKNTKRNSLLSRSPSTGHAEHNDSSDNPAGEDELPRQISSPHSSNRKDDEQNTLLVCRKFSQSLMKELDVERELRWRAEHAASKLSEQVHQLQNKALGDHNLQEVAVAVTDRLKQALMKERDSRARLQSDFDLLKEKNKELSQRLQEAEAVEEDLRHTQRAMETSVNKLEAEKLKQQSHQVNARLAQEAQIKASALAQEVEHLKNSIRALKAQVHQLQNLLAAREQEHRREMETRFTSGKKDIQEAIAKEISKEKGRFEMELSQQQERLEQFQQKYLELEDEFRMAMHLEASRYKELTAVYLQLQEAYVAVSEELAKKKQTLAISQEKERETAAVMMELTSMVKEQKARITELVKSKQESQMTVKTLESQIQELQRNGLVLDVISKEKNKLENQLLAQEAVIEGLKAEKKLWNQEMAQQGANIAHDRGKLESKIEDLEVQVTMLKKQLEREVDALRVKTKVIDEQTETIRKLKKSFKEKETEVKHMRESGAEEQRAVEDQLAVQIAINHELQQAVESITKRKEELKQQLADQQSQIIDYKKEQNCMSTKWKEKAEMISSLEVQVRQMKESWELKERKLQEERDRAVESARLTMEKLCSRDDALYKEIEDQRIKYEEKLATIVAEKQQEIDRAYKKVEDVEEEMKQMLQDTGALKKAMEEKVHKLTNALTDMQQDLLLRVNAGSP